MASCFVASQVSPGARALVIATDVATQLQDTHMREASQAVGAIAMLVSENPKVLGT